jgi:ubiquinone biosynthesis protein UbiJ
MAGTGFHPSAIPPAVVNRVLAREAWAQSCLAVHAGRTFALAVGPLSATMRVDASGTVEPAPATAVPDLKLALSPFSVPAFLSDPLRWDDLVEANGDPALATTLKGLAETLPWFVERVLAEALGPIVGQRMADMGRRLLALPEYAAQRVGESIGSFARDETRLATHDAHMRSLGSEVATLAHRTDALATRIDALAKRRAEATLRSS